MPAQAGIHNPRGFSHLHNWILDQVRGDEEGFNVLVVMPAQAGIQKPQSTSTCQGAGSLMKSLVTKVVLVCSAVMLGQDKVPQAPK
ncbi:hypothetical protein AVO43_11555 [Microbulbifer sp. ZGT114]|nr:hypothetical protein AVO43_11555 [Microbulbifer sp. ZGT114]